MSCACRHPRTQDEDEQNNNRIIAFQESESAIVTDETQTKLTFYGHAAFRLETAEGISIMIDPWQNDDSGFWGTWYYRIFPKTYADIVISTHDHFDHNALDQIVLAPNHHPQRLRILLLISVYRYGSLFNGQGST